MIQSIDKEFFNSYAKWTDTTAVYPKTAEASYITLGIINECGEFDTSLALSDYSDIESEAGDVLWYLARYCYRILKVSFGEFVSENFSSYNEDAMLYDSYPSAALSTIAGIEKKRIRDGSDWSPKVLEDKNLLARACLQGVLRFVIENSRVPLIDICKHNQDKINKRLTEHKIHGDGGSR